MTTATMSIQSLPLYEGDSLIHDAPARLEGTRGAQLFDRLLDGLVKLARGLERRWTEGFERERCRRIESALASAQDLHEIERRLVTLQRNGLL